jgi:prepilin-type N-terminal cleavage/methylation domain-containing protein/prepilin-type processing-associated H-X9-DG protein
MKICDEERDRSSRVDSVWTGLAPSGFTLVELLVVITIIGLLAGLSLGALARVRASADQGACVGHLQQIGAASFSCAADNDGEFPLNDANWGTSYVMSIMPYLGGTNKGTKILVCPADKYGTGKNGVYGPDMGVSYGQNGYMSAKKMARIMYPSATALTMDFEEHWKVVELTVAGGKGPPRIAALKKRHKEFVNVGYCDGHVGRVPMTVFDSCKEKDSESNRFWKGTGPELAY